MNANIDMIAIDTDKALADILSNFSEDYIKKIISQAFIWKFRPYENRMPNYAYIFNQYYDSIRDNYQGPTPELIEQDRLATYQLIIDIICENYNLQITNDIPDEQLYTICYLLCQIFLSEFTDNLIKFFSRYITSHEEDLIANLPEDRRNIRSAYSKKVCNDPNKICIYENMSAILDMVASLDIQFGDLLRDITDENTANFITSYIVDLGDIYKYYFASYILNPSTRSQVITSVKILSYVSVDGNTENYVN